MRIWTMWHLLPVKSKNVFFVVVDLRADMTTFNFNIGILGHVDSGKTSLAKALSTTASTACFDKNPQSKERGITLDLGLLCLEII